MRQLLAIAPLVFALAGRAAAACDGPQGPATDIVIQASDISQAGLHGAWTLALDATSSGGVKLVTWTSTSAVSDARTAPLAIPADYFDVDFTAAAGTPYRVWLRLEALDDSIDSDSVWVQFSDALVDGRLAYQMGTTSGLLVSLQPCSGCADSGWEWQDSSWRFGQPATVTFATTGVHRLRIQARTGGVQIDQIVVSPGTYLKAAPGPVRDDLTNVRRP
jgi:hypothetical protein